MIKQCVAFSLIVLGTLKQDFDMKTSEILRFLLLKNNQVTIGLYFLLVSISVITSADFNVFLFLVGL